MRKQSQLIKYLCSDFIAAAIAWFIFDIIRYEELDGMFSSLQSFLLSKMVLLGLILTPFFWIILHYYSGYYNKKNIIFKSRLNEFVTTFITTLIGSIIIFFAVVLNDLPDSIYIYYRLFWNLFALHFFLTYIPRLIITQSATKKIHRREWTINALLLGKGKKAQETKKKLQNPSKSLGYTIFEIDYDSEHDLSTFISENKIEEIIVSLESEDNEELLLFLYSLYKYKLPIKVPATYTKVLTETVKLGSIDGMPLIEITKNNFSEWEKNIKLTLDKIISIFVLLLLAPFYLYLALRIKLDSKGPIFITQERLGYKAKPFIMYKFRSMVENAENKGPQLSSPGDSRITKFGLFMRKYRLDELPQFLNILKGDMSLVGPRPERRYYISQIVKEAPYYYLLHNIRPGLTSWGMVKYGYASDVKQMIERSEYDILYYENLSLLMDLKILIYTVKIVFTGKGI